MRTLLTLLFLATFVVAASGQKDLPPDMNNERIFDCYAYSSINESPLTVKADMSFLPSYNENVKKVRVTLTEWLGATATSRGGRKGRVHELILTSRRLGDDSEVAKITIEDAPDGFTRGKSYDLELLWYFTEGKLKEIPAPLIRYQNPVNRVKSGVVWYRPYDWVTASLQLLYTRELRSNYYDLLSFINSPSKSGYSRSKADFYRRWQSCYEHYDIITMQRR